MFSSWNLILFFFIVKSNETARGHWSKTSIEESWIKLKNWYEVREWMNCIMSMSEHIYISNADCSIQINWWVSGSTIPSEHMIQTKYKSMFVPCSNDTKTNSIGNKKNEPSSHHYRELVPRIISIFLPGLRELAVSSHWLPRFTLEIFLLLSNISILRLFW